MLSPLIGFTDREILGVYTVNAAAQSGLALGSVVGDLSVNSPSPYGNSFGSVAPVSCTTAGTLRETGWLLQPVTLTGPSVFSVLASIYDESVAAGQTAAMVASVSGKTIATDQYVASGTGAINLSTVAPDTIVGIFNGQPRLLQSGDQPRLQYKGQVLQRTIPCAMFLIL